MHQKLFSKSEALWYVFKKINTPAAFLSAAASSLALRIFFFLSWTWEGDVNYMYADFKKVKKIHLKDKDGTFLRRKNSSLSSSSSSETMYASVLSILGMITCSIALTLLIILESLLEIDTCCTTPAVCGFDDLVQGDEGCLQARQLDKQVDCLLVVGLQ